MTVKVTLYQWNRKYDYRDDGVTFFSILAQSSRDLVCGDPSGNPHYLLDVENPVVLPTHKMVRFVLPPNDVIRSWWGPPSASSRTPFPALSTTPGPASRSAGKCGVYRGQCAEPCGKDHGFMPEVLVAKPQPEYREGLALMKTASARAASPSTPDPPTVARRCSTSGPPDARRATTRPSRTPSGSGRRSARTDDEPSSCGSPPGHLRPSCWPGPSRRSPDASLPWRGAKRPRSLCENGLCRWAGRPRGRHPRSVAGGSSTRWAARFSASLRRRSPGPY
jgi:hypothetical protein